MPSNRQSRRAGRGAAAVPLQAREPSGQDQRAGGVRVPVRALLRRYNRERDAAARGRCAHPRLPHSNCGCCSVGQQGRAAGLAAGAVGVSAPSM